MSGSFGWLHEALGVDVARIKLLTQTIFYISTTGSDVTGNGTIAKPWATPNFGMQFVASNYDLNGQNIQFQITAGTYTATTLPNGQNCVVGIPTFFGTGQVFIAGDLSGTTPTTILHDNSVSSSTGAINAATNIIPVFIGSFDMTSDNGNVVNVFPGPPATLEFGADLINGACFAILRPTAGNYALNISSVGCILADAGFNQMTIAPVGGACAGWLNVNTLCQSFWFGSIVISGTPTWSSAGANIVNLSKVSIGSPFSGSAFGTRFNVAGGAVINTFGSGLTYLPGSTSGTINTGGLYE